MTHEIIDMRTKSQETRDGSAAVSPLSQKNIILTSSLLEKMPKADEVRGAGVRWLFSPPLGAPTPNLLREGLRGRTFCYCQLHPPPTPASGGKMQAARLFFPPHGAPVPNLLREGSRGRITRKTPPPQLLQTLVCSKKHTLLSLQAPVCSKKHTLLSLQAHVCLKKHTLLSLQASVCSKKHTLLSLQAPVCSKKHTLLSLQASVYSKKHTLLSLQSSVCSKQQELVSIPKLIIQTEN